jgi:hypothetical protein
MADDDKAPADPASPTPPPTQDAAPDAPAEPQAQPMDDFQLEPSFKDFEPTKAFRGEDPAVETKIFDVERAVPNRSDED